ncbi:type II toxin-antitoxin system PemK/MazF family toxin [Streptococcus halichoeri]|uniref:type II toxin-antitoxin system PemK/MazF family toxin n=1 Tax=Streptococcus halichoeri TaxID=254785 RepID=UPI001357D38A|nr:type II toxin-antitoxin system PemK/MazF family toxin [Streptococcus halichoeri]
MALQQGTIIKVNFNPQRGHEQAGYRPALVISNSYFNKLSNLITLVPITNTYRPYPTRVDLDQYEMVTTGQVICEQIRTVDLEARNYCIVEKAPEEVINKALEIVSVLMSKDD